MKTSSFKKRPEVITDKSRENRIFMEIVADAYDSSERAMGWYYYLEQQLRFPFTAQGLGVPLSQLEGIKLDKETRQEIGDWHYWVKKGYEY